MAHNLFDEKFYSYREPAWHKLGFVSEQEHTPQEAAKIIGVPEIEECPTLCLRDEDILEVPEYKTILAITNKSQPICVVPQTYHTLTHQEFVSIWDKATNHQHVETLGVLGKGEQIFISIKMPTFDVKGDAVETYLMGHNPITGKDAITARTTCVRVVCQNTLSMAYRQHSEHVLNVWHKTYPHDILLEWLTDIYQSHQETVNALQEAYQLLANKQIKEKEVEQVISTVYDVPDLNIDDLETDDEKLDAYELWQKENKAQLAHRENVVMLVESSPHHTHATQGTAWGLYNSIIEYEDYGRVRSTPTSRMWGLSAKRKEKAYMECMSLV